jgi:large subunit ribosomal protein L24
MKCRIVRGDTVQVISGEDAGKKERVLQVMPQSGRIVVEHVNFVTKHVRRSRENPNGDRIQKEAAIDISNVMLVCPSSSCQRARRVKTKVTEDGKKIRVCASCGEEIPKPRS